MRISVEFEPDSDVLVKRVYLCVDEEAAVVLAEAVKRLPKGRSISWMTEDWGEGTLSSNTYFEGLHVVNHFEIVKTE